MRCLALFAAAFLLARAVTAQKVFAHFMVQNSYSYAQADWAADIAVAAGIGIDGFALNIAANDYESGQLSNAFAAAEAQHNFQLFLSFDMSYTWAASDMATIFNAHAVSSAMYKWNGRPLVSTYSGKSYGNAFFAGLKSSLANSGHNISFAPALTDYNEPSQANQMLSDFPSVDGFVNWWAWPSDNGQVVTTDLDIALKSAIKGSRSGPYIMSVSPWQFKNGPSDAWVELSDTLIKYRWEQAINTVKPDVVERTSFELTQDTAWVVVLATSPGVLTLHTGSTVQTYNVTAGANKLAQALSPGDTLQATLTRDDATVLDLTPNFTFQGATDTHNYNAFVSYVKTNTSAPSS